VLVKQLLKVKAAHTLIDRILKNI